MISKIFTEQSDIHDITRGGNSKCVGAGQSYYSGGALQLIIGTDPNGYSVKDATVFLLQLIILLVLLDLVLIIFHLKRLVVEFMHLLILK